MSPRLRPTAARRSKSAMAPKTISRVVDTTDGVLMLGAYGWAHHNPMRKLFYNLTITSVSVLVALVVGGIETLGLIAGQFKLHGAFWNAISDLNGNSGAPRLLHRRVVRRELGAVVSDLPL
jgi:hypothetical protein